MEEDTAELIAALGTRIGMIMEDVVDSALTLAHVDSPERAARLARLARASARIGWLVQAAQALEAEGG